MAPSRQPVRDEEDDHKVVIPYPDDEFELDDDEFDDEDAGPKKHDRMFQQQNFPACPPSVLLQPLQINLIRNISPPTTQHHLHECAFFHMIIYASS